jgi:hypothetical protein
MIALPRRNDPLVELDLVVLGSRKNLFEVGGWPSRMPLIEEQQMHPGVHMKDQQDKNLLVHLDCIHLGFGFNVASIRRKCVLTLEWEPVVEDQLNCKEVNDKASKGLVNSPKRVRIDRLMVT